MIYQLGMKTIEISQSPEGWRVRRYIWPTSVKGDPVFRSEAEAVAAVQGSSGRALKPLQPGPSAEPLSRLPPPPAAADPVRPRGRLIPAQAPPAAPRAPKTGKLDAYRHMMGTLPDAEVAKLARATTAGVRLHRERHGIAEASTKSSPSTVTRPPEVPAPKMVPEVRKPVPSGARASKLDAHAEIVGVLPDKEVAHRAGVTDEAVRQYRVKRGIPAPRQGLKPVPEVTPAAPEPRPPKSRGRAPGFRPSKLDGHRDIIGVLSDREVAERVGLTPDGVRKYRVAHGIQAAPAADRVGPAVPAMEQTVPASAKKASLSVPEESASIMADGPAAIEPEGAHVATPGVVVAPVPDKGGTESQPVEVRERRLTAFSLLAVRGDERETFVVLAARMSEALTKAEAALARGPGEAWEVVEIRAGGIGLA